MKRSARIAKKTNTIEKSRFGALAAGLHSIQCSHCSKGWSEDLSVTGNLAKSAPVPSGELAELRVQLNAQFAELLSKIKGLTERRVATGPARFNPTGVEKSDVAAQELQKALANGTPVGSHRESSTGARFQTVESVASGVRTAPGGRFVPDGFEKNAVAEEELKKSLANPQRVGW